MKKLSFLAVFFILVFGIVINGCDSPTETKATSVTAPSLSEPTDNASGVSLTPMFKWTGTADKLEYATNSTFDNAVSVDVTGNEYTLSTPLNAGQIYFWRAGKTNGSSVTWSATNWRFTTRN